MKSHHEIIPLFFPEIKTSVLHTRDTVSALIGSKRNNFLLLSSCTWLQLSLLCLFLHLLTCWLHPQSAPLSWGVITLDDGGPDSSEQPTLSKILKTEVDVGVRQTQCSSYLPDPPNLSMSKSWIYLSCTEAMSSLCCVYHKKVISPNKKQ